MVVSIEQWCMPASALSFDYGWGQSQNSCDAKNETQASSGELVKGGRPKFLSCNARRQIDAK
jgi:hypothetical protein